MSDLSKAKIFLAEERGMLESDLYRSYNTFNYGKYFNEYKIPFGDLYVLNDDSFAGGHSQQVNVEESTVIILLPVVGAIDYTDSFGNDSLVNTGELQLVTLPAGSWFRLSNPYDNELVNILQFHLKSATTEPHPIPLIVEFDLEGNKNSLVNIISNNHIFSSFLRCSIGQFRGREEALYRVDNANHGLFVFVIEGAFEVQGRLLHPRDGLAIWDSEEVIELEALSNEAVIFLMELG